MLQRSACWILWLAIGACAGSLEVQAAGVISQTTAARYGLTRAWYAQVGSERATGPITHLHLDRGMLLVQTEQGTLSGLNAETGRILWSMQVGPRNHSSTQPALNDKYIAVINGSVLYVLDRNSGLLLWQRQIFGSPGAGPALTETHAFTPMIGGLVEAYDIEKGAKQKPWNYKSIGRILIPPIATAQAVCWTTEKGYLYVADPAGAGIRYRLETRSAIQARPAYWTPNLYACSTDGCVYSVNELSGKINWKFPVGDAIYEPPMAIENKIFVISELGNMFCLDDKATPLWQTSKIAQFISTSPTRVYVADQTARMLILDAKTGVRLASMPLDGVSTKLMNGQSDRIYLANESGVVQCFREEGLKSPVAYIPPKPELPEVKEVPKGEKKARPAAKSPDDASPDDASMEEPSADEAPDGEKPEAMEEEEKPAAAADDDPFK